MDRSRVIAGIAQKMWVDRYTAEVVGALQDAGVCPVLLKGPVIVQWLYGHDRSQRGYNDADILVAPGDLARARDVLTAAGFECLMKLDVVVPGTRPRHAECWYRSHDHAAVDLHRCLHGTERVDPQLIWSVASAGADRIEVAGTTVAFPSETVRTLHAVLHLRPRDRPGSRAWVDLERAIHLVPTPTWEAAARLAREWEVDADMGALLRMVPSGRPLADRLALPSTAPRRLVVDYDRSAPYAARFLAGLTDMSWRQALVVCVRKVLPPPEYVRAGWPAARTSVVGLVAMYVWRWLLAPLRFVEWLRYRHAGGTGYSDDRARARRRR